jgi:predicted DNA-binding helix-hairpin-helix protein
MVIPLAQKLEILADAAKYDVSCASSGAAKQKAGASEIRSTGRAICHAYKRTAGAFRFLKSC